MVDDVLVCGAEFGARSSTGSSNRRSMPRPFGIQPRTLEVWDNLGLLHDELAATPLGGQLVSSQPVPSADVS
ncbi:MAG: hypothetical protein ACRDS0_16350 [Pseudonocardiaceae bacterium]